jgi:putative transposase
MERAGAWYHITARGTDRRALFREDRDGRFLALLAEAVGLFHWVMHGYVLLDNVSLQAKSPTNLHLKITRL